MLPGGWSRKEVALVFAWKNKALLGLYNFISFNVSSALSIFNFRVEGLEFGACIVDFELPIDPALLLVAGH